jgi:hypothetical protein
MGYARNFMLLLATGLIGCGKMNSRVENTAHSQTTSTGSLSLTPQSGSAASGSVSPSSVPTSGTSASNTSSTTPMPTTMPNVPKTWVFKSDLSLVQYIGGDIPLTTHQQALTSAGVTVYSANRAVKKNAIPLSIQPKDTLHRLTATLYNSPANPIYSGVHNAFQIATADLAKAESAGFQASIGDSAFAVPCSGKETLFIFGQSNSANSGDVADRTTIPNVYMFYNGFCYPAADPILGATMYNGGGSAWMPLARRFAAFHPGRELVLFSFGVGGSSVREWASGGLWSSRLDLALSQARAAGLRVTKVFWHQGESDTIDRTPRASYMVSFASVIGKVRAGGISAPLYMAVASYMALRPYYISREVQSAQLSLIEQNYSGIELGLVADFLPEEHRSIYDGLHFSAAGLNAAGLEWYSRAFTPQNREREIIRAYYNTLLSRNPTESDINYWQNRKLSANLELMELRAEIANTTEGFIRDLYLQLARRQPEYEGYVFWYKALETRTRADVRAEFEVAVKDLSLAGDLFTVTDGTLQPRADRFHFDRSFGLWVRK